MNNASRHVLVMMVLDERHPFEPSDCPQYVSVLRFAKWMVLPSVFDRVFEGFKLLFNLCEFLSNHADIEGGDIEGASAVQPKDASESKAGTSD